LTMAPLIRALGLDAPTLVEHVASAQANLAAKRAALGRLGDLISTGHFSNRLLGEVESQFEEEVAAAEAQVAVVQKQCTVNDMRLVIWSEALTTERTAYRNLFDHGTISEPVYKELELSNELRRDRLKRGMFPTTLPVATPLEVRLTDRFFRIVAMIAPRTRMVQRHRIRALAAQYELGSAVVEASQRVVGEVQHLGALSHAPDNLIEECRNAYRTIGEAAMNQIDEIAEHFPEYVQAVQLQTARRMALDGETEAIEDLAHSGGIPDSVARAAQQDIQATVRQLARQPVAELAPKPEELLARVPIFEDLSPEHFGRIADALVPRTALPGEVIIKQGERGRSLFLIARGVVAVLISQAGGPPRRVASLHAGDFFGEMALLSDAPRNATVQAVTGCQLYELAKRNVDGICETFPGIKQALVSAFESRSSDTVPPARRSSGHYEV
jgi:Na+:H+ antiporter